MIKNIGIITNQYHNHYELTEPVKKAIINVTVIPLLITIATSNILLGLCWIMMLSVIYKFIQTDKIENARMFFLLLKYLLVSVSLIVLSILILVIA